MLLNTAALVGTRTIVRGDEMQDENNNDDEDYQLHDDDDDNDVDEMWNSGSVLEIKDFLQCDDFHHNPKVNPNAFAIHGHDTWKLLRHVYRRVVGEEKSSLPPEEDDHVLSGMNIPFEIVNTPDRGRAVVAKQTVEQGSLIWKSTFSAQFTTAQEYRLFLQAIPPAVACDVMEWAWTRFTSPEENQAVVCVDLEPSTFTNGCDLDEECNHGFRQDMNPYQGCTIEFHATNAILSGDELLADYETLSAGRPGFYTLGLYTYEETFDPPENEDEEEDEEDEEDDADYDDDEHDL